MNDSHLPLDPDKAEATSESVYLNRRKWMKKAAWGGGISAVAIGGGYYGWKRWQGTAEEVLEGGKIETSTASLPYYPAKRDERFKYGRKETDQVEAARYTNFFEFTKTKATWRFIDKFKPLPWTVEVAGLCRNPMKLDMDQFQQKYKRHFVERLYRHRCVEKWAMAIPWTGIPLSVLLKEADPLAKATHVRFVSFNRPDEASMQRSGGFPWPYVEGLTVAEAMIDLTLVATGIYGQPLLKQHGAPIRLVVPWKYGFKSIKSIERIELVDREPKAFWTELYPRRYPFQANVDPTDTVPWSQSTEWMLGTRKEFPTKAYNGYGEWVKQLYTYT